MLLSDCFSAKVGARCALLTMLVFSISQTLSAQDQDPQPAQTQTESEGESTGLPKLADMKVPTVDELVKGNPVDWIVLNSEEVIVTEPVYPRPDTLNKLNQRLEESRKWPRPQNDQQRAQQEEQRERFKNVTVVLPQGGEDSATEYNLSVNRINRIIYHEDLILRRVALLRDEEKYRDAFEMLFTLSQKFPQWPGIEQEQDHLVFAEANTKLNNGKTYSALVFLEQLHETRPNYSGLKQKLGEVTDRLVDEAYQAKDYRRARHFLGRLTQKEPGHQVAARWVSSLSTEATGLMNEARQASENGRHDLAAAAVATAADIWPATPGLKAAHARYTARYQKLEVGVLQLAGDQSAFPLTTPAQERITRLTEKKLFELSHIDKIPQYRSKFFEQWLPTDLGRQAVFTMRQNRNYWDAHPEVNALSVASTISARLDPQSPDYDERLASFIKTLTVETPYQLRVQFSRVPLRTETMFRYPVVELQPVSQDDEHTAGSNGSAGSGQQNVVTGSFRLHKKDDQQASYRRYLPEPDGVSQYHVAEVIENKYESYEKAAQGLLRGEFDMLPHLRLADVAKLSGDEQFHVLQYSQPVVHVLQFNPQNPALRNSQFRRALAYALDRPAIMKEIILDGADPRYARLTTAPFPRDSYAFNPVVETQRPYDITQGFSLTIAARKQLKIDKLPDLKLVCTPDPVVEEAAAKIAQQWAMLDLKVELVKGNAPVKDWDVVYRTVTMPEPVTGLWPFLTLEPRARVESLIHLPDWLRRPLIELDSATDWNSASDILKILHRRLFDEVQYVPLWEVDDFLVLRKNVAGFPQRPMHPYQSIELWKVNSWYPSSTQ